MKTVALQLHDLGALRLPCTRAHPRTQGNVFSWDTDTGTVAHMYEAGHKGPVHFAQVFTLPSYGRCVVSCGAKDHTVVGVAQRQGWSLERQGWEMWYR